MKRNRIVFAALLVLVSAVALVRSRAASPPSAPPGVSPEMWHPISDRLGIVIREESTSGHSEAWGVIMMRDGSLWRRVNLETESPGVMHARRDQGQAAPVPGS